MRVLVVADDLTGGNGTAALLKQTGFEAWVHLGTENVAFPTADGQSLTLDLLPAKANEAHVLDLGTRNCSSAQAAAQLQTLIDAIRLEAFDLVALRIDSTLRGPIAPSLNVLLAHDEQMVSMVVPAHPSSGRTTVRGVHLVHGVPVHETPVGADPFAPVLDSALASWIGSRCDAQSDSVPLTAVEAGVAPVCEVLSAGHARGVRIWFCDAKSLADIDTLAKAAQRFLDEHPGIRLLPADSGPFTAAVARAMCQRQGTFEPQSSVAPSLQTAHQAADVSLETPSWLSGRIEADYVETPLILGVSASLMNEAKEQIDVLERMPGVAMVKYNGESPESIVEQMRKLTSEEAGVRNGQRNSGVFAPVPILVIRTDTWATPTGGARTVKARLPGILRAVAEAFPSLAGFYLSGGEAARAMLSGVGVTRLAMQREVAPITTLSIPVDGWLQNKWVLTKGGTIGSRMAAVSAMSTLYDVIALSHQQSTIHV